MMTMLGFFACARASGAPSMANVKASAAAPRPRVHPRSGIGVFMFCSIWFLSTLDCDPAFADSARRRPSVVAATNKQFLCTCFRGRGALQSFERIAPDLLIQLFVLPVLCPGDSRLERETSIGQLVNLKKVAARVHSAFFCGGG